MITPIPYLPSALYVADEEDGTITVINADNNSKAGTIMVGSHNFDHSGLKPHNVQTAPDGKSVWVTCAAHTSGEDEQVVVIDPLVNHSIRIRISLGGNQHLTHVVLDSASRYAYVAAYQPNEVIKIDAQNYNIVKRIELGSSRGPHGLRISGDKLFIANMTAKSLTVINTISEQITEVALGGVAIQTAVTPDRKYAFVSLYDTKSVARYDIENQQISFIQLPSGSLGPIQMYPTPDNRYLYVCDQGGLGTDSVSNKVYVIDILSSSVINTITAGAGPHGVVVNDSGSFAYVTNFKNNTISVIDIVSQSVTYTISTGKSPNGISYKFPNGGMP
jgi:YVTN family beta-propeller protein